MSGWNGFALLKGLGDLNVDNIGLETDFGLALGRLSCGEGLSLKIV